MKKIKLTQEELEELKGGVSGGAVSSLGAAGTKGDNTNDHFACNCDYNNKNAIINDNNAVWCTCKCI